MVPAAVKFFMDRFGELIRERPELPAYYRPRPYRNAAVTFRKCAMGDFDHRLSLLETAGLNTFLFPSASIPGCDLLSDSGTSTMTMEQWASMFTGDEAYGSNEGYFDLLRQVEETFGPAWSIRPSTDQDLFIFH
jgi:tryptophanase